MRARIQSLWSDPFLRNNAVFFVGSLVVSALNYLYHPILSRLLSVQSFGDLETILVLYGQVGILLGVFGKIVINAVVHSDAADTENDDQAHMLRQLYTLAMGSIGTVALLVIVFALPIKEMFRFESVNSVLVLALLILISVPFTFQTSILQGVHDFKAASVSSAIGAGGRLLFAGLFILLGFGLQGAIMALAFSQIASLVYTYIQTRAQFSLSAFARPHRTLFRYELPYALLILISGAATTILFNSDIVVVKYFFSPEVAGLYSGVSVIDNALFFVTGSIAGVLLPSIRRTASFRDNALILKKAFILTFITGGVGFFIFVFFPALVVRLMIGAKYLSYSGYLPYLAIMIFMVALSNLLMSFFLALRDYMLIPISVVSLVVLGVALAVLHSTILGVIASFILGSGTLLLLLVIYYFYYYVRERQKLLAII